MSDISTKLTYLNTTKTNLKDMINNGLPTEKQITNQTTFRNYVGSIFEAFLEALRNPDTLFTNLPKTSGSGSNITLNNTANAPMRITLNPTALEQTTYTGQQLFNVNEITPPAGVSIDNNGWITATYDNTSGSSTKYLNTHASNLNLSVSTDYNAIVEVKSVSGNGTLVITSSNQYSQFSTNYNIDLTEASANTTYNKIVTTKASFDTATNGLRSYVQFTAGQSGSITFRISLIANTSITPSTFVYEPYVGGTAAPNPQYPQDIHTISGNNSVVVEGKNLISSVAKNGNRLFFNGANETDYQFKSGTYTFSFTKNISGNIGVFLRTASTSSSNIGGTSPITFTSNEDFNIWFYRSGIELTDVSNVQLEKGSVESPVYTPYVSQTNPINLGEYELGTIGNYSNEFVRSGGENLFNPSVATSNCSVSNGVITITTNSTDLYIRGQYVYSDSNKFLTLPSGNYYVKSTNSKVRVTLYGNNGNLDTDGTQPKTLSSETNFGGLRIRSTDSSSLQNVSFSIMLSTANIDYVPYEKGWYYKQGIGKVVLDGTENWWFSNSTTTPTNRTVLQLNNYITFQTTNYLSNYFVKGSTTSNRIVLSEPTSVYISLEDTITGITNEDTNNEKRDKIKNWLSNNNTTLYYVLATPTYTKITGELANQLEQVYKGMLSYDGTTNISQVNNDLAFVINASGILGE